jgi:hypothetical protein
LRARATLNRNERFVSAKAALKQLQEERAQQSKQAEHESGLYWCNYGDVRYAYEVARVRAMRTNTELREHQWNGSGQVSVRFQRGLPVRTAFTCRGRRLQIDPVPEEAWTSPMRSTRRKLARSRVRIRVASTQEQLPVWFEIPVVIHRPMPSDGLIRRASLIRERLGLAWRYRLILTVARAQAPASVSRERPSIGIDIGWRLVPEGLRVAFWADTLDRQGSLPIPERVLDMKGRTVSALLGIPYADLRKGERVDAIIPIQHTARAQELIALAQRAGRKLANRRLAGQPRLSADLPFARPRCRSCQHLLNIVGLNYSNREGSIGISNVLSAALDIGRTAAGPTLFDRKEATGGS